MVVDPIRQAMIQCKMGAWHIKKNTDLALDLLSF